MVILIAILLASIGWLIWQFTHAQIEYQDETGFHRGEEKKKNGQNRIK